MHIIVLLLLLFPLKIFASDDVTGTDGCPLPRAYFMWLSDDQEKADTGCKEMLLKIQEWRQENPNLEAILVHDNPQIESQNDGISLVPLKDVLKNVLSKLQVNLDSATRFSRYLDPTTPIHARCDAIRMLLILYHGQIYPDTDMFYADLSAIPQKLSLHMKRHQEDLKIYGIVMANASAQGATEEIFHQEKERIEAAARSQKETLRQLVYRGIEALRAKGTVISDEQIAENFTQHYTQIDDKTRDTIEKPRSVFMCSGFENGAMLARPSNPVLQERLVKWLLTRADEKEPLSSQSVFNDLKEFFLLLNIALRNVPTDFSLDDKAAAIKAMCCQTALENVLFRNLNGVVPRPVDAEKRIRKLGDDSGHFAALDYIRKKYGNSENLKVPVMDVVLSRFSQFTKQL